MKVAKFDQDQLPQLVREYILHDRGNSLFLGDSFANLPSPVNEDAEIKKIFKFNEDDPIELKKRKNESKNNVIRVEGKKDKTGEKKAYESDRIAKKDVRFDFKELDRIVFSKHVSKQ